MGSLSLDALFSGAGLTPTASTTWGDRVNHKGPGVYVISIEHPETVRPESLGEGDRPYWNPAQPIIYVGRAENLSSRLGQFYRHRYGKRAPHHGGEAILKIDDRPKRIDWVACDDYAEAERNLIEEFVLVAGRLPFGNLVRAARLKEGATRR